MKQCSFCERTQGEVEVLFKLASHWYICSKCIEAVFDYLQNRKKPEREEICSTCEGTRKICYKVYDRMYFQDCPACTKSVKTNDITSNNYLFVCPVECCHHVSTSLTEHVEHTNSHSPERKTK